MCHYIIYCRDRGAAHPCCPWVRTRMCLVSFWIFRCDTTEYSDNSYALDVFDSGCLLSLPSAPDFAPCAVLSMNPGVPEHARRAVYHLSSNNSSLPIFLNGIWSCPSGRKVWPCRTRSSTVADSHSYAGLSYGVWMTPAEKCSIVSSMHQTYT